MRRTQTGSDYQAPLLEALRDPSELVRARFKGRRRGREVPWARVELRPVRIRGQLRVQVTYHDARKAVTRNLRSGELAVEVRSLVALAFSSFFVETRRERLHVQVSRRGRPLIQRERAESAPRLEHDRPRRRRITPESSTDFLRALGLMGEDGRIRPTRFGKYRQINEFVRVVEESVDLASLPSPVEIVDLGCGNAYLTFALFHYLERVRGLPAELCGVDRNPELLAPNLLRRDALGWKRVRFEASPILDFEPLRRPSIVTALHVCDTATDEALARAVAWETPVILAAPCCHHHVQAQLSRRDPAPFAPLLRHGILKERLGTLLTDSLRAAILRLLGYRVDVIEFVASEHTDRNVLLRAVRLPDPPRPRGLSDYVALRDLWRVTPRLEQLVGERLPAEVRPRKRGPSP